MRVLAGVEVGAHCVGLGRRQGTEHERTRDLADLVAGHVAG